MEEPITSFGGGLRHPQLKERSDDMFIFQLIVGIAFALMATVFSDE